VEADGGKEMSDTAARAHFGATQQKLGCLVPSGWSNENFC
jgi:hypothetical protein